MDTFLQAVIQGVGLGSLDALLAMGIVLIYRMTGVLNFAQAATGALGTYVIYSVSQGRALWLAVAAGLLASAAIGVGTHRALSTMQARQQALTAAVATLAVAVIIEQAIRTGWGTVSLAPFPAPIGLGSISIGSLSVADLTLWSSGTALVLALGIGAFLRYTRVGTMMRALADNPDAAGLCGGNIGLLVAGVWAASGALAGVAGFFAAQVLFDPTVLDTYFVGALIAAVLGGLRSLTGAFAGAVGLEIAHNLFSTYAPANLAGYTQTFLILLLIVVLVIAPKRWLASAPLRTV
jgi:branched-chain amino acid transport system permease protein